MAGYVRTPIELLQLITDDRVATLLNNIPLMALILPYARAVQTITDTFLSDVTHRAVAIQRFGILSEQLEEVNRDLENIIRMEAVNMRYGPHIASIQTAIKSSMDIARARNDAERQGYEQIFKEVCSGGKHTLAMNSLIEGLRDTSTLQINIMDRYYTYTGGHLRKVRSLANELLLLVFGGFLAMHKYKTLMRGNRFAETVLNNYNDVMGEAIDIIQSVFKRCQSEHRDNMLNDMNGILDSKVSNSDAVNSLSRLVSEKYDWLENYCIVCDESSQMDCCFKGDYVSSFGRNGRFGVVFYQDATEAAIDPTRQQDVTRILESFARAYWRIPEAEDLCRQLTETFRSNGIETRGCAVIKPKTSFVYSSLYTVYHGFLDYANTIGFQKKGNSLTTVHYCRQSHIGLLGPKVIHFIIQLKQTTNLTPVNLEISYNIEDDAVVINEF